MSLLRVEAEKLSQNKLVAGVIEEIVDNEALYELMEFIQVNNKSYDYVRENTISEGEFLDPYDDVPEGAAEFTEVTVKLKILAGQVLLDNFLNETMSDTNDQMAQQIAAKAKGLSMKFKRTLVNGDSATNAKEFDGLKKLCTAAQTISTGETEPSALTLTQLDELLDMVPNGADVIMMRSGTLRAYRALLRAAGGNDAPMFMIEDFGRPLMAHNGTPIIVNDYIAKNETFGSNTKCTSIYAVRLNTADGLHGIYGGEAAGIRFEHLGTHSTKDAQSFRLKWYVALALKSTLSLARLEGVTAI